MKLPYWHSIPRLDGGRGTGSAAGPRRMMMTDRFAPRPPGRVRGRAFEKGRSGNTLGRRVGCRNKTTIAAAALLAGEAEALTRKAVELALVGDPTAPAAIASNASCRDERGYLGTCRRGDYAGRGGDDRGGVGGA